ncbi:MAG: hypothetical protein ACRCXC_03425 [Legionella sp.]
MSAIQLQQGLLLEYSAFQQPITSLIHAQELLKKFGTWLWPIDLLHVANEIKLLLKRAEISAAESDEIQKYFALTKEELIKTITDAWRKPHLMHGFLTTNLFVVKANQDYSCYDRFHVNTSADGVGVDEIMQMISGVSYVLKQQLDNNESIKLRLDCPVEGDYGWL